MDKSVSRLTQVAERLEKLNGGSSAGAGTDLTSLIKRIEGVIDPLSTKFGVSSAALASHVASTPAPAPKPTPQPTPAPAPVSTPAPQPKKEEPKKEEPKKEEPKKEEPKKEEPKKEEPKKVEPKKEEPKKEEPKKEEPPKKVGIAAENPKTKEILEKIEKVKQNDPSIEEINWLGNSSLKTEHAIALAEALSANNRLKKLILTNAQINSEAAIALSNALKTNSTIEILHLETNNIGPDGILAIAEAIKVNTSVSELKMTNQSVSLTIDVEKTLAAAFDTNQTIVKFTSPGRDPGAQSVIERALTRNAEIARQKRRQAAGTTSTSTPSTAAAAGSSASVAENKPAAKPAPTGQMAKTIARIEENDPTLIELDLNGNPVCSGKHGVLIGKALVNNTNLKVLLLDGTVQDTDAAVEIANALKVNKTLEVLSLEKNDIGPDGIKALAEALVENSGLTELRLRDQKKVVGIEVEKAFMPALETNQSLVKLSFVFKDNGVRNYVNRGITRNTEKARQSRAAESTETKKSGPNMVAIQKAIDGIKENNPNLTEVSLNDNVVCSPEFGIQIAQALEKNTNLKSLTMDSTFQNSESAIAFAQALKKNQTLEVLSLEYNDIAPDGMKALAESLAENKSLRELRLNNQKKPTGNEAERALAEALDKNTTLCKLSLVIKDAGARNTIDRVLTKNTELSRGKKK